MSWPISTTASVMFKQLQVYINELAYISNSLYNVQTAADIYVHELANISNASAIFSQLQVYTYRAVGWSTSATASAILKQL
jgi:hypothetical protein